MENTAPYLIDWLCINKVSIWDNVKSRTLSMLPPPPVSSTAAGRDRGGGVKLCYYYLGS